MRRRRQLALFDKVNPDYDDGDRPALKGRPPSQRWYYHHWC